ncbi:uncharacterized protein LOC134219773 isoform X2 [Armigeres subalbatus]|uniref:uncharacterized protein LOC134219773 isoform X2 n=1 Tax=Armigeres subalbatus TaxID=124917 RepID=UPI002ED4F908
MSDFNPREPIRLSEIDNLLEDSIFKSSNGAKLADYIRKKRGGGGRVRLHNIFEQVAANLPKPNFNFDMDSSDPNPLPDSPAIAEQLESAAPESIATTSAAPVPNENVIIQMVATTPPAETPSKVVVDHAKLPSPRSRAKSPVPVLNLGKQALLNQYHRTNMAKCELLKQITSSTPKPDTNVTMSRISAFTTSISPIIESSASPIESEQVVPLPVVINHQEPVMTNPIPTKSTDPAPPIQVLAPCSQAPTSNTPQKATVVVAPAEPVETEPDMVIPETPSPNKVPSESPKLAHHIRPRKLTDTFNKVQNDLVSAPNGNMTSDESESIAEEQPSMINVSQHNGDNSVMVKSILKDKDATPSKKRVSNRVSFSQQLVHEREISPAPSIPEAHYSSSSDDDDDDDYSSDNESEEEYAVVDEVYSDDGAECDSNDIRENYNAVVSNKITLEKQMERLHGRSPSPLINVVEEAPVRWYETRTPRQETIGLVPFATCTKENKTNLQLVDIITDWDEEDEYGEDDQQEQAQQEQEQQDKDRQTPEKEPHRQTVEIPETQQSTQHTNQTNCQTIDITNVEDSAERLVELPSLPEGCDVSNEYAEPASPLQVISPPSQFTDSAKRRFLRENDDALISRLQNEIPDSQRPPTPSTNEKVSETLAEVIQSFREQLPKPSAPESSRALVAVSKKKRRVIIDPATTSYFETVEKTFVKPKAPAASTTQLTTAQKRKLYATSKPLDSPEKSKTDPGILCKKINIVIRRLKLDECLQMLTDADRAVLLGINKVGKKPRPKLGKKKDRNPQNRIDTQCDAQAQRNVSPVNICVESDANSVESNFCGFPDSENLQRPPDSLSQDRDHAGTNFVTTNGGVDTQRDIQHSPNTEIARESVSTAVEGGKAKHPKSGTDGHSEIRLISNGDNVQQAETSDAVNRQSKTDNQEKETTISRQPPTSDSADNAQKNLQKNPRLPKKRGRPRKGPIVDKANAALISSSIVKTNERVSTVSSGEVPSLKSGEEVVTPSSVISERLDSAPIDSGRVLNTESTQFISSEKEATGKANKKTSRTKLSSTSSDAKVSGSSELLSPDSLPLKKRSVRTISEDGPPTLEPFGGNNAMETSDIEPPLLLSQDPVPATTSKRTKKSNTDKHHEKHTTETSEKQHKLYKSRYYKDPEDENDETWMPSKKNQKNQYNRRIRRENEDNRTKANSADDSDSEPIRRSKRKCRLAKATLMSNPQKSVYDKPDYKLMTEEELITMQRRLEEEKRRKKKAKATADGAQACESSAMPRPISRKRVQGDPEEPVTSKRNKADDNSTQASQHEQLPMDADADAGTVTTDRLMQEKMDTYEWIHKLMHGNPEENERMPVVADLVHYSLQHLNFKEHNGIQYSFYLRSDNENFGFLRFSPQAVKKLTKTSNFQLNFLVISGNLTFTLNGNTCPIKSGDFLMLPANSRYAIQNGEEVSLIFMAKICSQEA